MFFRLLPVVALLGSSLCAYAATPTSADNTAAQQPRVTITLSRHITPRTETEQRISLGYSHPVRLERILLDSRQQLAQLDSATTTATTTATITAAATATTPRNYWQASALYTPAADPAITQLKDAVLRQIDALIAARPQANAELAAMKQWVSALTTQKKRLSGLDLDTTLIDPQHNPLLKGDALLVVPQRPDWIQLVGAFRALPSTADHAMGWGQIRWQPRTDAAGYLNSIALNANHNASEVWVIQPNGDTAKHPIAYWNASHHDIAPGAVIFIPFDTLPDAAASLNDDLLVLIQNSAQQ